MKVLIIHHILWAHYRNRVFSEVYQQAGEKYQIKVIQIARNEISRASMEAKKNSGKEPVYNYDYELLEDTFVEKINNKESFLKIIKIVKEFKPDVVNLGGFHVLPVPLSLLYCHYKGIKIILTNDSTDVDNKKIWWKSILKRYFISLCDGFFNFGTLSKEYMKSLGGKENQMLANRCATVDNDYIESAYNKALPQQIALKEVHKVSLKNFIYIGRFIDIKNLFRLLDAFDKAKKENLPNSANWGLILLGDGILKESLQKYIAERAIKNVCFIPGKAWYEIPEFLTLADVLVLPSESEPWGLVVNEAMICKMPVIVSDKCGCAVDLVQEDKNGYVFPYNDTEKLKIALEKFINNEVNIEEMGNISRKIIQDYTPQKVAKSMLQAFDDVVTL